MRDLSHVRYEVFIAYSASDCDVARKVHSLLARHHTVFLDSICLIPGDNWDIEVPRAQREALITVVLISSRTATALYQREEVAAAIALSREDPEGHRVVPVFLVDPETVDVPYGLRRVHSIIRRGKGIKDITEKIRGLLRRLAKGSPSQPAHDTESTRVPGATQSGVRSRPLPSKKSVGLKSRGLANSTIAISPPNPSMQSQHLTREIGKVTGKKALGLRFSRTLDRILANIEDRGLVLGVIDIDNQTGINHRYGSAAGDLVISSVRNIVLEFAVGRYAGTLGQDSFYVVFTSSNAESARFELQNLCQRVSTYDWSTIAKGLYVTCTGGVAEKHSDESTLSWAIRAAEGWRAAKMLGGNSVVRGPLFTKKNDTEFSLS